MEHLIESEVAYFRHWMAWRKQRPEIEALDPAIRAIVEEEMFCAFAEAIDLSRRAFGVKT